jgi:6-phosphogluconate dehydrogenase
MPGGPPQAVEMIAPIMKKCAAQVSDGACFTYLGPIGAGNYVKMVHNGIEYGDMQLISEVYDVLKVGITPIVNNNDKIYVLLSPILENNICLLDYFITENSWFVKPRDECSVFEVE